MARDPAVWGDDCCQYKPSRWIDESGNLVRVSSFKFHAFNGGPRLCLGQNLAYFDAISGEFLSSPFVPEVGTDRSLNLFHIHSHGRNHPFFRSSRKSLVTRSNPSLWAQPNSSYEGTSSCDRQTTMLVSVSKYVLLKIILFSFLSLTPILRLLLDSSAVLGSSIFIRPFLPIYLFSFFGLQLA